MGKIAIETKAVYLYWAVSMFISIVKLGILTWGLKGIDFSLNWPFKELLFFMLLSFFVPGGCCLFPTGMLLSRPCAGNPREYKLGHPRL